MDWAIGFPAVTRPRQAMGQRGGSLFYLEALRNAAGLEAALGDSSLAQQDDLG